MPKILCLCAVLATVSTTLHGDLDAYFSSAFKGGRIPPCAERRIGSASCLVIEANGTIRHGRDLAKDPGSNKQMLMDMFLRGAIDELKKSGRWQQRQVSFLMVYTAAGASRSQAYPVLSFGKREPWWQPGGLMPNPFFVTPQWWDRMLRHQFDLSGRRPWETRVDKALFRGACGPGARARLELANLRDELLDVGFTKVDGYATMDECIDTLAWRLHMSPAEIDFVKQHRVKALVPQTNFSQYRYLVHMPGSATGSYSRNLQYLWPHGAVVLIWEQTAAEHYYQYLRPGTHYLPVNATSLRPTLELLRRDSKLRERLREGAKQFVSSYLSGASLIDRWLHVLRILWERQTPTNLTAGCSCEQAPKCAKCIITTLKGTRLAKFVGVLPKQRKHPTDQ